MLEHACWKQPCRAQKQYWIRWTILFIVLMILRLGSNWRTLSAQQCRQTKVEPFAIPSQQCGNVCDRHDHIKFVFWFLSNISAQQIFVMTFTKIDLSQTSTSSRSWAQQAVNMVAPCWKLLWGWYVSGFELMGDQEKLKISVKCMRDVQFTSIRKKQA